MTAADMLEYALDAFVVLFVAAATWWVSRHPNRSKKHPEQVRLPKIIPVVGWLVMLAGLVIGLAALTSDAAHDAVPMRIASVALVIGGVLFLLMYRNWYVAAGPDAVHFRTGLGREHTIAYRDIRDYRYTTAPNGRPMLIVRSTSGAKLSVIPTQYDVSPLLAAIAFQETNGRWPLPGEFPRVDPSGY